MDDAWVNARIEIVVPLDVPVSANKWVKQEAVGRVMDEYIEALPEGLAEHVVSGSWEDFDPSASPSQRSGE